MIPLITLTPNEAHKYEKDHPTLKLRLIMMHLNGVDTYEILTKETKLHRAKNSCRLEGA